MKFAHYEKRDGSNILGIYSTDVHEKIPEPNFELTEEQWQEFIRSPGKFRIDVTKGFVEVGADLEKMKLEALVNVSKEFDDTLVRLTGGASVEERDTWTIKEAAANAVISDTATPAQVVMLTSEAAAIGVEVLDLANTIVDKATAYYALVGAASGMKRAASAAIKKCTTLKAFAATMQKLSEQRDAKLTEFE